MLDTTSPSRKDLTIQRCHRSVAMSGTYRRLVLGVWCNVSTRAACCPLYAFSALVRPAACACCCLLLVLLVSSTPPPLGCVLERDLGRWVGTGDGPERRGRAVAF